MIKQIVVSFTMRRGLFLRVIFLGVVLCYVTIIVQLHTALESYIEPESTNGVAMAPIGRQTALAAVSRMNEEKRRRKTKSPLKLDDESIDQMIEELLDNSSDRARPSSSYLIDQKDIWESMEHLPIWFVDYCRWHKEQIAKDWDTASENLPSGQKFLFVSCEKEYKECGGVASRLLSLPFLVKVASETNRLLLFQWSRPADLEEFLLPPVFGIDWRVPKSKLEALQKSREHAGSHETVVAMSDDENIDVLRVNILASDDGSSYYDINRGFKDELNFEHVFALIWKVWFTPSLGLASHIDGTLYENSLVPGQYTAAHVRAMYTTENPDHGTLKERAKNSVRCAVSQQQAKTKGDILPVYFSSDSHFATLQASYFGSMYDLHIAVRSDEAKAKDPLDIDKDPDWASRPPTDFYDTFADLYLMALGKCVTYGMGNYGKLSSLLTSNPTCSIVHTSDSSTEQCNFPDGGVVKRRHGIAHKIPEKDPYADRVSLFLEPMPAKSVRENMGESKEIEGATDRLRRNAELPAFPHPGLERSTEVWKNADSLPLWVKDYFAWHQEQRARLTEDTIHDFKFLVMVCLKNAPHCGGTADRLRSIPFMVRAAAESKRILLIKWEKPSQLESFLVPPKGGLDWRTPDWLVSKLRTNGVRAVSTEKLVYFASGDETFVKSHVQAHDHGSKYYNRKAVELGEGDDAFRQHYHDMWYSIFTPVPAIAEAVKNEMKQMHLAPGEYAFAHLRSAYGIEEKGRDPDLVKEWTENALNCVSILRPGGPFFFSSDSSYAKTVAAAYGKRRNVTVATRLNEKENPLHLDLAIGWETRSPSEYYSVFIDLYLMSFGRCYTYNMGGFSKWANLISGHDFTCNVRHWTAGVDKKSANKDGCTWTPPAFADQQDSQTKNKLAEPVFLEPMPA